LHFIFSTGSLYNYSLDRCFSFAQRAGFDGIELMIDSRWDTRQPEYLLELAERYQQPIRAVHTPFDRSFPGFAKDEPEAIAKSVGIAEQVGAAVVIHHLPMRVGYTFLSTNSHFMFLPVPFKRHHKRLAQWLQEQYATLQASAHVHICIENMPAKPVGRWRLNPARWNATNRRNISDITRFPHITMDTTHLGTWGLDPAEIFVRWGKRVKHVHLSNFNGREHRRPEDGEMDLGRLLAQMAQAGYSHSVSLELEPSALDAGREDEHIIGLLGRSLAQCRAWATL
jgi:sugar phosphate isomerase/epimerase